MFNTTTAMGMIVSVQLLLILFTSYLYFKNQFHSNLVAILGSTIFSFSAYNIGWLTWATVSFSLAFLYGTRTG